MNRLLNALLMISLTAPALARTSYSPVAEQARTKPPYADHALVFTKTELEHDIVVAYDPLQRQVHTREPGKFTADARTAAAPFTITYYASERDIVIIGNEDQENAATVSLVTSIQGSLSVRVELSSGGVATGSSMVAEFPLYPGPGTILTGGDDGPPDWESWIPDDSTEQPLVNEIFYLGGDHEDLFDNQTDIPSYANGDDGNDVLLGGSSTDWLRGDDGDDEIRGRAGDDRLDARYGNNRLIGGNGDDDLEIVSANANVTATNTLCGGDGSDHLIGHHWSNNDLAGAFGGNTSDGDQDTLEGHYDTLRSSRYAYIEGEDILIENDVQLGAKNILPTSDVINCN